MKQHSILGPPLLIMSILVLGPSDGYCKNGLLYGMGATHMGQLGILKKQGIVSPLFVDADVRTVVASSYQTYYISNDGTLWGMGKNSTGLLGTGDTHNRTETFLIDWDVLDVTTSMKHTLYIKRDGSLWGMGDNTHGQLGIGNRVQQLLPVRIASNVKQASAGQNHNLFVKTDGSLWAMGKATHGRLGSGDEITRLEPILIDLHVRQAAAGGYHSLYVKEDGTLKGMGLSLPGALGTGKAYIYLHPIKISDHVTTVVTSTNTTLFLKADNSLWGMGYNGAGQLGFEDPIYCMSPVFIANEVCAASSSSGHTLYLKTDRSLWGKGENDAGQLGIGDTDDRYAPVKIDTDVQVIATGSGHSLYVKGWRTPDLEILQPPQSLTVASGETATFTVVTSAITSESYTWSKEGAPVGTDSPELNLVQVEPSDAGRYKVTVYASGEQVSSRLVTLGVRTTPDDTRRLMNVSTRGMVQKDDGALIVGFVAEGAEDAQVLMRGVGPTLKEFGVSGFLSDPRIDLISGANECLASNETWGEAGDQIPETSERVGAFPLREGSLDAAMCYRITPGVYTAQVKGLGGDGIGLGEVYAVDEQGESCRLKNLSTRCVVGTNDRVLIAGFVLTGEVPQCILIRGVGPGLKTFGIKDPLKDPVLRVTKNKSKEWVATNDDWGRQGELDRLISETRSAGAFPLERGSRDAAILTWLEPGAYTATLSDSGDTTGVALVEVYQVGN